MKSKKIFKKLAIFLLCVVVMGFSLVSCKDDKNNNNNNTPTSSDREVGGEFDWD